MKENYFIDNLLQESILSWERLLHRPRRLLKLFECLLDARDAEFSVRFLLSINCGYGDKHSRYYDVFDWEFHKGAAFCPTSKMSHDGIWRASCRIMPRIPSFHFESTFH